MQKVRRKSRTFGVHYIDLRPSLLKYGNNGWLIQEQKSVSDGQIYAFNEVKGVSKILFKSNR